MEVLEVNSDDDSNPGGARPLRLATEREVKKRLPVSLSWLQKDRRGAQIIPFIRLGDRVLYDLDAVDAAVRNLTIGGTRGRRGRTGGA
jgi:hypothetical protein